MKRQDNELTEKGGEPVLAPAGKGPNTGTLLRDAHPFSQAHYKSIYLKS